ncbi:SAVED domain-containing protein [Pseudomonas sp. OIL-1]|uniref:SAVED domain-containing protein n=1 Tax=Pseudomonas sp. OIL-1 TaxID=2706126 RepID=UPI0013A78353|nr:SAVED domain-containing protein [Pseudomonas sp. OIL-1]QIB50709.1 SAVED domain-containing protein [Pseudomonas sp. OIL-1]
MKTAQLMDSIFDLATLYFRRSPTGLLLSAGVTLMLGGPWLAAKLVFRKESDDGGYIVGEINTTEAEWWVNAACLGVGALLIAVGLYFAWITFQEQRRKLVIALELRGLSQTADSSIQRAIPSLILGRRESIFIDVRQLVQGTTAQKQEAVSAVNLIPIRLKQLKDGRDRDDLSVYAGGLAPVPLLFLTGNLLAAESKVHWLDWNRKASMWVSPCEGADLTDSLPINYEPTFQDVVLAFSVSYPIERLELTIAFPGINIIELKIENPVPGIVVSEVSIQRLMQDFMSCIATLKYKGTKRIHLILAAPSILSIRLGSCYAGRNMPELIIYQYQQAQNEDPYPWGIRMPNSETSQGELVVREKTPNHQITSDLLGAG